MSTKTIYKRIALVAVASLGFGLLSAAPSSATATAVTTGLGTITLADGSAVVGSTVTIPLTLVTGTVDNNTTAFIATATFAQRPVNTALAAGGLTASVVGNAAAFAGTAAAATNVARAVPTANAIAYTHTAAHAAVTTAAQAGTYSFVPDVPGLYIVTIDIPTGGTSVNLDAITKAATLNIHIQVGGAQLIQATGGKGSTTGTATTGGSAVFAFAAPGATAAATRYNVTSTGVGSVLNPQDCANKDATLIAGSTAVRCAAGGSTTEGNINGVNTADGVFFNNTTLTATNVLAAAAVTTLFTVDAVSAVAGTQTIIVTEVALATGIPTVQATLTITWGATPVVSAALSTAFLGVGSTATVTANVAGGVQSINTARTAANQAAASINVITRNTAGVSLLAAQTLTVVVTGPGTVSLGTDNTVPSQGRAITGTANQGLILVFGDGTSGTSTITISQGTTVISTKTVTFYGAVATLTAVQNHRIANSAGGALGSGDSAAAGTSILTTPAVVISAKDVNGNAVPGLTITALSSDTTVMSNTITIAGVTATPGNYNVQVNSAVKASGSTATLTFRVMSGTTVVAATAPLTYTLGGGVSTVALSLDAASYDAGAPAVATLTLKDSSGNAAWDNDYAGILTGALTSSLAVTKTLQFNAAANTAVSSLGGVSTVKLNAPGTSASAWTISGTTGAGPGVDKAKALSATASVSNASADAATDAANEATDAANAATDAALAAADAADAATAAAQDAADAVAALSTRVSTLVSNLRKQITALTKLVQRLL